MSANYLSCLHTQPITVRCLFVEQERPMYCGADVNDGVEWSNQRNYDYHDDAQTLLRCLDAKEGGDVEEEFKYTPEPDSQLNLDANSASVALSFPPPATLAPTLEMLIFCAFAGRSCTTTRWACTSTFC